MTNEKKWEQLWDAFRYEEAVDIDDLKHLIFDTYDYLEYFIQEGKGFPLYILPMYKNIVQTRTALDLTPVENVPAPVSAAATDFLEGLCYIYEHGSYSGYYKRSIPLGLTRHTPAGYAEPEANMETYDTFLSSFEDLVAYLSTQE
jgi:hypothetical protein